MSFLAMMFVFWAIMRWGGLHRMRHWQCNSGYTTHPQLHYHRRAHRTRVQSPRENAFDTLKRRYVEGDLNDSEYEAELDALLRTPEGRRIVH
jgi:uncharacterized membrane protein